MTSPLSPRRGGPQLAVTVDLVRHAFRRRSWVLLIVIAFSLLAAALVLLGQAALPYAIYPAL